MKKKVLIAVCIAVVLLSVLLMGIFSSWHKITIQPAAVGRISNEEFSVYSSEPLNGDHTDSTWDDHYKEYHVNEFFSK